jgi:mRNA interferase RelE/StbE
MQIARYHIIVGNKAQKELNRLPESIKEQISAALDDLQNDPRPPGCKKLHFLEGFRIRQGNYRVLYAIDDKKKELRIFKVGHRRDVYRL